MVAKTESKIITQEVEYDEPMMPCPFCCAMTTSVYTSEIDGLPELEPICWVECGDCGAHGPPSDDVYKAVKKWDTRRCIG